MIVASHVPVSPDPAAAGSRSVDHDEDHQRRRRRSLDGHDDNGGNDRNGNNNRNNGSTMTPRGGGNDVHVDGDGIVPATSVRTVGGGGDWPSSRRKGTGTSKAAGASYPRDAHPPFPLPGSLLSSRYFVLGRLGRGTFCSIHKCVDLAARNDFGGGHGDDVDEDPIVAAKIELSSFANSGVLDGEAQVLRHLHKASEPRGEVVPRFVEYLKDVPAVISKAAISATTTAGGDGVEDEEELLKRFKRGEGREGDSDGTISAIVMQYLPGEDMARLRDGYHTAQKGLDPSATRRMNTNDAVYLCADVMLPLIRSMHRSGVIHRDVKPSNVVRVGSGSTSNDSDSSRRFRIVDFGLSKSFVVPRSSAVADTSLPWDGTWDDGTDRDRRRQNDDLPPPGCQRRERERADFRGTSMYASPRVHALRDYCRRDDVWSLMYAFCDFVSGGLPWTQHALARDRDACGRSKERIHADGNANVAELLCGPAYHRYVRPPPQSEQEGENGEDAARRDALKLNMARDGRKVQLLREAFNHLGSLEFGDEPDYDLLERCMVGFVEDDDDGASLRDKDPELPPLDWNVPSEKPPDAQEEPSKSSSSRKRKRDRNGGGSGDLGGGKRRRQPPSSSFACWTDPIADEVDGHLLHQLRVAKVEYNARRYGSTPSSPQTSSPRHWDDRPPSRPQLLTDWLSAAIPLVYEPWDVARHEKWGEHRNEDDGYRREEYVATLRRCLDAAGPFGFFADREYHGVDEDADFDGASMDRRLGVSRRMDDAVRARVGLRSCIAREMAKPFAPPPAISFSG